ncbi:MAG TPA: hypothetical protein VFT87_05725 [Candidatus Saccharimonadales bacterium]|nr:hypothetical protein [Candidatus Saccharimonadales bacterium]
MAQKIASGVAHTLPTDLRTALGSAPKALAAREDITPLARTDKAASPSQRFMTSRRTKS